MKKQLFVYMTIVIGFIFCNSAYSQGNFGAEVGVNFANIKGDDLDEDDDSRTGLLLALYYQYPLENTPIILQPEVMYSQKGLTFGNNGTLKLDYIVASVLAAYYIDVSEGGVTPFAKAGPYVGFNVVSKADFDGHEEDVNGVNSTDVGVILRAGVQINERFEAGLRFARGFTDAFEDEDGKNQVFGIFVGVGL